MTEVLERAGEFVDPVPDEVRDRWSLTGRTTAFHDIHQPETMAAAMDARRRLVFDELLRVQLRLVQRKRELERTTPGHRPRRRRRAGAPVPRTVAVPADRRAAARASTRSTRTWPARTRCTGCCRATSARARRVVAVQRAARRRAGRPSGRADGPDRGAGRAALPGRARAAGRIHGARHRRVDPVRQAADGSTSTASCGSSCSPTAPPRPSADGSSPVWPTVRSTWPSARTRSSRRRSRSARWASVVIDEQHRFGVEQRAALRAKSSARPCPTCW